MKIMLVSLIKDYLRAEKPKKPKGTIFLRFPSLALANLASLTPEDDEITVIDEQISPIDYNMNVDLVAISVNTSVAKRAYEIADNFRKKGVKVVFGGLHPSLMPDESLKYADSIVIGDANESWKELLIDFKKNKLKRKYISNQKKPINLPTPKWEIFKKMSYLNTNFIEVTRGCSHNCKFCSTSVFYHHLHRKRPIKEVIRDIKKVKSFPKNFIFFVDDNIACDREYAKKLFKALIPLKIIWISQATVDIGEDEELVKLASESGCGGLFLGFDSISKLNLEKMNKKHNYISYLKSVRMLQKYEIVIEGGFMFGFDNDTKNTFRETLEFLKESKIESFLAMYLTPIPGTKIYNEYKKQNKLLTEDHSLYDFRHVVARPKKITPEELYEGVSFISKEFYQKKEMNKRIKRRLFYLLKNPSVKNLFQLIGTIAINLAFRDRIKNLSKDGTFPKSYRNI
ncbi:radical SAM protein [Candidatus Pacearchaeota archaeon]|nr:radical SAM protein [Candidatus Pacearchaeota archaeon]MBD3283149.1 radical SAM protein [Candidatus Pacearchaeota archaeon]